MDIGFEDKNSIVEENLKDLTVSISLSYEERLCEIALFVQEAVDYVKELMKADMSFSDAITALREEGKILPQAFVTDTYSFLYERVAEFTKDLSYCDKVIFSEFLCDFLAKDGIKIDESDLLPTDISGERFIYVKNVLSDEAFDVFSQEFDDPRIVYAQTTKEALRSVADGSCDYCIVPFEEKGGARIIGIYATVAALDLKIAAVTPIFGPEGDADVKYALVGRDFIDLDKQDGDDVYIEISIPQDSSLSVSALLSAAEKLGLSVYRIGSIEYDRESDGTPAVYVSFRDSGNGIVPLLAFLEMFVDDFSAIGLYKNIE